ncbi:hypothetical protein K501DRAFT_248637 [Backusella circina FSU 941]|nr:hypothetical protein K501DRAFT_248637 [Backusella circina FSU 941]
MSVSRTIYSILLLSILLMLTTNVLAGSSSNIHTTTPWKQRPRQFRMMVYSRPFKKGTVQNLRTSNGGKCSPPCWNLASKRVGSFEVNDPLVKVTFFRASDCRGAPSATFKGTSRVNDHVLIKAGSVSITKMRPLLLKDQHHDL